MSQAPHPRCVKIVDVPHIKAKPTVQLISAICDTTMVSNSKDCNKNKNKNDNDSICNDQNNYDLPIPRCNRKKNNDDNVNNSDDNKISANESIAETATIKKPTNYLDKDTPSSSAHNSTPIICSTGTTTTMISKNRRKKLEKMERTKKKNFEKKEREKARKRDEALSQGRDLDAERKFREERTKSGDRQKRLDEIWNKKLEEAQNRFEICIDLGGREREREREQNNDNNDVLSADKDDEEGAGKSKSNDIESNKNNNIDNDLMLSNFEKSMRERERASLAQQIRYCYSYNKNSMNPVFATVTGLSRKNNSVGGSDDSSAVNNPTTTTVRTILERETGFCEWKRRGFECVEKSLEEYYGLNKNDNTTNRSKNNNNSNSDDKEDKDKDEDEGDSNTRRGWSSTRNKKIVYLTSDSSTTLDTLDDDTIYVIGGIVDRNRLRYATMNRAQKELNGVQTAKLPLTEYLLKNNSQMSSTKVLTVNHVFDIMLKYKQFNNDWGRAFQDVLPRRKDANFGADVSVTNNESKVE